MIWDKVAYIIIHALINVGLYIFAYYQSVQGHEYWAIFTLIVALISSTSYASRLSRWYGRI